MYIKIGRVFIGCGFGATMWEWQVWRFYGGILKWYPFTMSFHICPAEDYDLEGL